MTSPLDHRVAELNARYQDATTEGILAGAFQNEFQGQLALVSSFGTESAILLHMIAAIDRATPIIFLDTGKLFGETRRYRDQLIARFGLTGLTTITPEPAALNTADPNGVLWSQSTDACCDVRKVQPLDRALAPFAAWITGRKSYQGGERTALPIFETDTTRIKINPLAGWSRKKITDYFDAHDLQRHPLEADGYLSIGCVPCTSRVAPGEDPRAGRWRGTDKTECGIHVSRVPQRAS